MSDDSRDLTISRVIRASRADVWRAWTDPALFAKWWVPAPAKMRVVAMDFVPGGAFRTEISEDGTAFGPHMDACFLAIEPMNRIVFTTALTEGWRPAQNPFITAVITFSDHAQGTEYTSYVMHKDETTRAEHLRLGFHDGWGTVIGQLAELTEGRTLHN